MPSESKKIKLTDYIFDYLSEIGVKDIFMISGGGAMHLVDSVGRNSKLNYICPHHEQAAAIAAEGYARASGKMGVVVITSGPGGTNTLTGVISQWLDSVPVLYLSGQLKKNTVISTYPNIKLRQIGDQEINIIDIVKPVTKYAVMIKNPNEIKYHLKKAIYIATHGRPGPVWIDIPLDVQSTYIKKKLIDYNFKEDETKFDKTELRKKIKKVLDLLKKSKRPLFLAGQGIRIASAKKEFMKFIEVAKIPVLTSFCGFDLISSDHPFYVGRPGTLGTRFGNFNLRNADLLLSVGSRNNIRQTGYNYRDFAKNAKKIIIDIDTAELEKPTIKPDIAIFSDARDFLSEITREIKMTKLPDWGEWVKRCDEIKRQYPIVLPKYWKANKLVNPYCFMQTLSQELSKDALMVAGNGSACVTLFQAGIVKKNQRLFWNSGCASMGYDIPASIGACFAIHKKPVVCLAGDGSLQMNIQELQTIAHHKLPIKIFVLNNNGYMSIMQTQNSFFSGKYTACNPKSGVTFPDIIKVAKAYGLATEKIKDQFEMRKKIKKVLKYKGPILCEVLLNSQGFSPRSKSKTMPDGSIVSEPLEDMYPVLSREELKKNYIENI